VILSEVSNSYAKIVSNSGKTKTKNVLLRSCNKCYYPEEYLPCMI